MARKVVSRMKLRDEAEAAAARKTTAKKKTAKTKTAKTKTAETKTAKKTAKKTVKRKTRTKKAAVDERKKIFWGIFSQSLKRVALYEYHQKKQAEKKAVDLSKGGKAPHFVQKVKEVIEEN